MGPNNCTNSRLLNVARGQKHANWVVYIDRRKVRKRQSSREETQIAGIKKVLIAPPHSQGSRTHETGEIPQERTINENIPSGLLYNV